MEVVLQTQEVHGQSLSGLRQSHHLLRLRGLQAQLLSPTLLCWSTAQCSDWGGQTKGPGVGQACLPACGDCFLVVCTKASTAAHVYPIIRFK